MYSGYPQAQEDHAERAVRAGLELLTDVGTAVTYHPLGGDHFLLNRDHKIRIFAQRSVTPALNTPALPQHEILKDELAFAARKWRAANAAGDLTIDRLGTGFLPDHLVQRIAGWARKRRFSLP